MTDRTPTGDLRERLTEALRAHYIGDQTTAMGEHLCVCGEWADGTDTDDWDVHLADAVLPVVEDETAALRQRAAGRWEWSHRNGRDFCGPCSRGGAPHAPHSHQEPR